MQVTFRKLVGHAKLPSLARVGDAGLDLAASEPALLAPAGGRAAIHTGIAVELDANCVGYVAPRSGLALDHGVTVLNGPGIIDSGYRGEIVVILVNLDPTHEYEVRPGDRVAQLVIAPRVTVEVVEAQAPTPSERGVSGLGDSGR